MMKSNNVRLRYYRDSDFEFLHELLSDEATKQFFPFMYTIEKEQSSLRLRTRLKDQHFGINTRYVIEDKRKRKAVGEISGRISKDDETCMELAILIHPDFRGQGFAKDGILKFIEKMRELNPNIDRFRMEIAENNKASQVVAKKLDFKFKGDKEYGNVKKGTFQCWEDK